MNKAVMNRALMNRTLKRWANKPAWQLYLSLWGLLGLIGVMAYGVILRPEWAERKRLIDEITQQQQNIDNQQSVLVQLPSILSLREQINTLLQKELLTKEWLPDGAEKQQFDHSLAHFVGEWIRPFGGQVVRWQRVVEPIEKDAVDAENNQYLPDQKKKWNTTLRVNFYGALHLFHQLSLSPVLINVIEINRENHALTIKLSLKDYPPERKNE
jgi:pilus assembly protein HofO